MTSKLKPKRQYARWTKGRVLTLAVVALGLVGAWLFWPFWQLSGQFGSAPSRSPSRLYGRPPVIEPGMRLTTEALREQLLDSGYLEAADLANDAGPLVVPGSFRPIDGGLEIFRRAFPSPRGKVGGDVVQVAFRGSQVARLSRDGQDLAGIWLDPPLVASFYGPELQERRPVGLDEIPEHLIYAVLAAEDTSFLSHKGISVRGILRAAWTNFRASSVQQGGSTLTQQLVKNLYLTHERRWVRKIREALLAVLLEIRYEKRAILEAYLNEIYWGRSGSVDLMGIGAASWAYFGKEPAQLTLGESALLAGMIQSPANLSPLAHPKEAEARRDVILGRLDQLRWISRERLAAASREPVDNGRKPRATRSAPYFADAMVQEAKERFGIESLDDAGYVLCSTLDVDAQVQAEDAVSWGLEHLKSWEKDQDAAEPLQAALVSLDPEDGGIRAYVGGSGYHQTQFDRVRNARRQAGSAFKPIVYAAAFERRVATPATLLQDEPFSIRSAGKAWSPKNSDGRYHGWITARDALEKSYNVSTARLALRLGLDHVVEMAGRLGIRRTLKPFPALALGAMEVTPLEMATVYATLASGGRRHEPHGLTAVFDRRGKPVQGRAPAEPEQVLGKDVAFVLNQVLKGVLDRGTAKKAREDGFMEPAAGKTGTTNDRRDSWFAGYSPDHATLVWVGYDDNSRTRLSGARAALPIWTRFVAASRPAGGYRDFALPAGVVAAWIDPRTGGTSPVSCSLRRPEYFLRGTVPGPECGDGLDLGRRSSDEPDDSGTRSRFERILDVLKGRGGP